MPEVMAEAAPEAATAAAPLRTSAPGPPPTPTHRLADLSRTQRWWAAALTAGTVLAIVVTSVWARQRGWYPIADDAILAVRSSDVGGRHTPLVGMPTSLGGWGLDGPSLAHPGPLLFWLYAPFVHVLGPAAGLMTAATSLGLLATGLGVWAAYRARGVTAALLAWPFLVLMLAGAPYEPLNSVAAIVQLAATMLLAWAAASGVRSALPWAVLTGSLVVQAYLPMALAPILACALALWCTAAPRARRPDRLPVAALVTTAVVAILVWWGPLFEALTNSGGNVRGLLTASDGTATAGWSGALDMLLWMTSIPPPWAQPPTVETADASLLIGGGNASGLLLLFAALVVAIRAWPRWDRGLRRLVALAALGLVGAAVSTTRLPATEVAPYQVWWAMALAVFAGYAACIVIAASVRPRLAPGTRWRGAARGALVVVLLALLTGTALVRPDTPGMRAAPATEALARGLSAELAGNRPLAVVPDGHTWGDVITNSITMSLITGGRDVSVDPAFGHHWGTWRVQPLAAGDPVLVVSDGFSPGHPVGARLLGRAAPEGWSDAESRSVSEAIAGWARAHGPIYSRGVSDEMRSILAGWVPALPCDRLEAMLDGSEALDDLPDGAIAQLYLDNVVASPSLPGDLTERVDDALRVTPTELWLTELTRSAADNTDLSQLPGIGSAEVSC